MANIYTGNGLKIFYNEDTANRLPQNAGNEQISEIAAMPTLHIAAAMAQVETYNSEYVEQLAGEQNVDPVEITVNYIPGDYTHTFLDEATETQKEFQLILIRRHSEGTLDYSLMNGRISAAALSGDKDSVVQKTYTFTPTEMIVRDATALASVELYEGSYGVGSNGVDVPQYEPLTPTGNSFIKVPADQIGNPVSVDMMGVGLIDGNTFSSIAMTKSGSLAIYAKNQTTAWTRILTSNLGDSKYVALTGDQSIDGTKTFIKGIYVDSLTSSNGISGKSLTVTESINGDSITVNNSTLGTAQADNLTLGQPLSVANGGTGSKNATDARSALGVKAAGTFDIVPIANGGTNASTALQARINLDLISKTESDTRYLKTASNLSDLSDVGAARTNLLVQGLQCNSNTASSAFNVLYSPDGSNSFRLANDGSWRVADSNGNSIPLVVTGGGTGSNSPAGARINLQLDCYNQSTSETYIQSPDKLKYFTINNSSWGMWNTQANSFIPLGIQQGGTSANDVSTAKVNLQVDRLNQFGVTTSITSGDRTKSIIVNDGGTWGGYNETSQSYIPLGINQGGTGGWDQQSARANLGIERLQQQDNGTFIRGNGTSNVGLFVMDGTWGAMNLSSGARIALPINNGGTGALDVNGARNNLGLGKIQNANFGGVFADTWSDATLYNGGIIASTLYNTSSGVRALGRMYTEIQSDGIPKLTLHASDGTTNQNAYYQFYSNGTVSGISTIDISGKTRTGTLAVVDRMSVGTPGDAQGLGARSIAIGDHDTGFAQRSDGVLDVYTDGANFCTFTTSGFTTTKPITSSTPAASSGLYLTGNGRSGGENALVRGKVDGVDFWDGWRDQASGLLVEMPRVGMISTIWKCTHWGTNHVAAMQVYYPTSGIWYTSIVTGNARCIFGSDGVNSASNWLSTSDKRLKSNIEPITGSLDKLKQITGYTYDKRSDLEPNEHTFTTHEAGVIAQEVQKVLPEAVSSVGDDKILGVSSYALQALVINSVKELNDKVDSITIPTNELDEMRNTIKDQQSQIDELKALVQSLLNK
ncbi:tail fiber domain-containing protein [Citrobacter sp. Cb041]|uniref:tail fiber domain-containing protein n=1 Tax=Citrobacter sp. Cb041 TaxID=2985028 RepID=UPI002580D96B|nr:tail fiber domain-containing protein [Citrobacter sp. Cb041]MDM3467177.1 tail fiber domain-containing protein [Citrobacter sp. Cb041]